MNNLPDFVNNILKDIIQFSNEKNCLTLTQKEVDILKKNINDEELMNLKELLFSAVDANNDEFCNKINVIINYIKSII